MKFKHILFDWGNTLMRDFKEQSGAMCEWSKVEAIPKAREVLAEFSRICSCHVATNAQDSNLDQVIKALGRVGLRPYLDEFFLSSDIGFCKPSLDFFRYIISYLNTSQIY